MIIKFDYRKRRDASHILDAFGVVINPSAKKKIADLLAKADDKGIVEEIADFAEDFGTLHVSVPKYGIAFRPVSALLADDPAPAVLKEALSKGIWEIDTPKSFFDVREFDGPFRLRFDWNGPREVRIDPSDPNLDLSEDGLWYHQETAGTTKGGLTLVFEAFGTRDIFGNIRTSGSCLTRKGEQVACCGVFVVIDGQIAERIDDVDVCADDITLREITDYTDNHAKFQRRCREQFIRNLKDWLKVHPEKKMVDIDPDCGFCVEMSSKHWDTVCATILAVGIDEKGDLVFDTMTEYDNQVHVHLADDWAYGVIVTDWNWALRYLLEHFENPYEPDDENDNYDEDDVDESCRI